MTTIIRYLLFCVIGFCIATESVGAANVPFTDVSESSPYYEAVGTLFANRVISDDGSHLFRPNEPMQRDFFVSLVTTVGCKTCETPTLDDIARFYVSPFVDLPKTNPYYYCIAYAKEHNIAQGYITDLSGNTSCQDGTNYTSNPFCPTNQITRIEAAAMLLRQANLWNESLNANPSRSDTISDVTDYWYGYAQKAISIGLIRKNTDNTIRPDEYITRGEFAMMAAKAMELSQCNTTYSRNTIASQIVARDDAGLVLERSHFREKESFSLFVQVETTRDWGYHWSLKNDRGDTLSGSGNNFDGSTIPSGRWFVTAEVEDPTTGAIVSRPTTTIVITPGDTLTGDIGVMLSANPLSTMAGSPVQFSAQVTGNSGQIRYQWDFGDGNRSNTIGNTTHTYGTPGIYEVTLTVTDTTTGNVGQSRVIISITDNTDSDGDGIMDADDLCPEVRGSREHQGCPNITNPDYFCLTIAAYGDRVNCPDSDSDGDGIPNGQDQCPTLVGPLSNHGCPLGTTQNSDTDGDGITDLQDRCPQVQGRAEWGGCPNPSILSSIPTNICLANKAKTTGLITGMPICSSCPCENSVTITSILRDCDVVFPTILSPDLQTIYSRGNFYLIP